MDSLERFKQLKHDAEEQKYQHLLAPIITPADLLALLAVAEEQHDKLGIALTEIAVLRGEDCERDTDGPCGVCIKCCRRYRAQVEEQQKEIESWKHSNLENWWNYNPRPANYEQYPEMRNYVLALEQRVRWLEVGVSCSREDRKGFKESAEAAEAKLSAMEEVVEAAKRLARSMTAKFSDGDYCLSCKATEAHKEWDGFPCPVGIVLSFTNKEVRNEKVRGIDQSE